MLHFDLKAIAGLLKRSHVICYAICHIFNLYSPCHKCRPIREIRSEACCYVTLLEKQLQIYIYIYWKRADLKLAVTPLLHRSSARYVEKIRRHLSHLTIETVANLLRTSNPIYTGSYTTLPYRSSQRLTLIKLYFYFLLN